MIIGDNGIWDKESFWKWIGVPVVLIVSEGVRPRTIHIRLRIAPHSFEY